MRLFSDQIRLLLTTYQDAGTNIGQTLVNEAIAQAYRQVAGALPWTYLHRQTQIYTVAPYKTGTIAYNAATNVMTLTGGTWPSWANQGQIIVPGGAPAVQVSAVGIYWIQNILSSTTVSLIPGKSPPTDIPAGTGFTLVQTEYPLPLEFVRTEDLITTSNIWVTHETPPGSVLQMQRLFYFPSRPWIFLVRGSSYFTGQLAMVFSPPPDAAYPYDLAYFSQPRQRTLAAAYTSDGSTQSVSVSGTAVTGVSTNFTQAMVGCRIRQAYSGLTPPVGEFGIAGSMNENSIQTVNSPTSLTLVTPGVTSSGVGFVVDDPIDVDRLSMDEVFCRMCEYQFAILTRDSQMPQRLANLTHTLNVARARDVIVSPQQNKYAVPINFESIAYANLGGR